MYLHCSLQCIDTLYRRKVQLAPSNRNYGSFFPEHWLSLTGTVAQNGPDYPLRCVDAIRPMERIGGNKPQGIYFTELAHSEQAKIRKLRIKLMEHLGQSPC